MARYAIISDIHGNAHALMAVYDLIGDMSVDQIICLGDIVGYGPSPARCLALVVGYCNDAVRGNHDEAVLDPDMGRYFNTAALAALNWTREQLGAHHLHAISQMKTRIRLGDALLLVHDTPVLHETAYVNDIENAAAAFSGLDRGICLHGHTHLPSIFETPPGDADASNTTLRIPVPGEPIVLVPDSRYLCNPGSIGQPRDADPRASFAIFEYTSPESEAIFTLHRTPYDVEATRNETELAGLPQILGDRLTMGA